MEADEHSGSNTYVCILCERSEETKITGPLSHNKGIAAHQNCLLYASAIYCKESPTYHDLFGFDADDVRKERKRGKKLTCYHCKKKGATVGCEVKSCPHSFHYPCAKEAHATTMNSPKGLYKLYCKKHSVQKQASRAGSKVKINGLQSHHGETSSGSESASSTGVQRKKRKMEYVLPSNLDDMQTIDLTGASLESDPEDCTPPDCTPHSSPQITQAHTPGQTTGDEGDREEPTATTSEGWDSRKRKQGDSPCQSDNETDIDSGGESPSVLASEHRLYNVPLTVVMDSVESIESENSSSHIRSPGPASAVCLPHPLLHATQDTVPLSTSTPTPICPTPPVPRRLSFNSPSPGGDVPAESEPSNDSTDNPVNLQSALPPAEPEQGAGSPPPDSSAALFWKRCNDLGCTETLFAELTGQVIALAERVQTQDATEQDYTIALRILEASGKLPDIFQQQERDLEERVHQLQKKMQMLKEARAILVANQLR